MNVVEVEKAPSYSEGVIYAARTALWCITVLFVFTGELTLSGYQKRAAKFEPDMIQRDFGNGKLIVSPFFLIWYTQVLYIWTTRRLGMGYSDSTCRVGGVQMTTIIPMKWHILV